MLQQVSQYYIIHTAVFFKLKHTYDKIFTNFPAVKTWLVNTSPGMDKLPNKLRPTEENFYGQQNHLKFLIV